MQCDGGCDLAYLMAVEMEAMSVVQRWWRQM